MPVRSDRLGSSVVLGPTAAATVFTVPAGQTWLVKRVVTQNAAGLSSVVRWFLADGLAPAQTLWRLDLAAGMTDDHETWWAFDQGLALRIVNDGLSDIRATAFGAKLQGIA